MKSLKLVILVVAGAILMTQISCSKNPTSSSSTTGTVKISIKSISGGTPASSNKVLGNTAGFVTITSARVVIDEIELESIIEDSLDFEFEEPFVKDLLVGSNIHIIETIQVPFGSYKELEIEIDDLDQEDGVVFTQNPDLQGLSILVKGYLNDDPSQTFVFTSDLDEEQEREFNPPLVLDENSPSNSLVLTIDLNTWFVDSNGNFLNPSIESNHSQIENNIKDSLEVFEDKDDDGEEDDDD